jgi:HlyD family secretion protein
MSPPYRSDSLDSLVSSDDLNQASSLIRFKAFLFLLVFSLLLVLGVACCIFITIPIKVSGPSVIWSDVGVLQVSAKDPGSITSIGAKVGDRVEVGQVIAKLDQSGIVDQLTSVSFKLQALKNYIKDLQHLQVSDKIEREGFKKTTDKLMLESTQLTEKRLSRFRDRKDQLQKLLDDNAITFDQFNTFIDRIEQAEDKIISDQRMVVAELKEENFKHTNDARELLQKKLEAEQLSSEVKLLENQLADQGELRSPVSGRVVEVTASVGDFLSPGSSVLLVQPDADEGELTFVVFISSEQVKPVKSGMRTELELSAFPPTKYGKLVAEVTSVSPMPLSSSALMKELRNDQLVNRITEVGSPFMVKVDILKDPVSGNLVWSSASDAKRELQVGMVGQGSIITRYERLVWLLLPQTE